MTISNFQVAEIHFLRNYFPVLKVEFIVQADRNEVDNKWKLELGFLI